MKVPFGTLGLTDRAKILINKALYENKLTSGKLVAEFEDKFAEFIGTKEAVAVSSGTDAITIALAALHDYGALAGKEVIVPALTFIATANAVLHAGFEPVFVDIDRETLCINADKIPEKMTRAVCAILPVHLMGKPVNMKDIERIAGIWQIPVIEDAAEAHGGKLDGKNLGSLGLAGCFSLYAAHIISSIEGGMITTNSSEFAEICRSLRNHGKESCNCKVCVYSNNADMCPKRFKNGRDGRFIHSRIGYSSKMNELEAAVGIGSMEQVNFIIEKRKANFYFLQKGLEKFDKLYTITEASNEKIGPHAFPIMFREGTDGRERDELGNYFANEGIDSRTNFQCIPTQSEAYSRFNFGEQFPNAEHVASNGLHVGIHQDIGKVECEYIIQTIEKFFLSR